MSKNTFYVRKEISTVFFRTNFLQEATGKQFGGAKQYSAIKLVCKVHFIVRWRVDSIVRANVEPFVFECRKAVIENTFPGDDDRSIG